MSVRIGISGWKYEGWEGSFYPEELAAKKQLSYASHAFSSIEINGTFYSMQTPKSFIRWYEETPDNFVFSVKANRYITHIRRLNDIKIPLANFFASGILELKEKLGPILWQFPPSMRFDPERFEDFLKLLPHSVSEALHLGKSATFNRHHLKGKKFSNSPIRHAIEIRHDSFLNPEFIDLLRLYRVALVFADTAGKWPYMEDITADFLYLRLHGDEILYESGYDEKTLQFWARRLEKWHKGGESKDRLTLTDIYPSARKRDIYLYFDNDLKVKAPENAQSLIKKIHGIELAA